MMMMPRTKTAMPNQDEDLEPAVVREPTNRRAPDECPPKWRRSFNSHRDPSCLFGVVPYFARFPHYQRGSSPLDRLRLVYLSSSPMMVKRRF